ncbi:FkbM family methyltransferase [Polluticoccus soli]|uniref:FkbM family methyltransferase n=1 Tax=Polluticoccus soli TaxID=3034150 RepID=UPI0023E24B0C|nr:FkbM family methyltransferase [Flavipsychrobacter sp. JY13-12]
MNITRKVIHKLTGLRQFQPGTIQHMIAEYCRRNKNISFVQVGANDGITWDNYYYFIKRYNWKGIVIEPQSVAFEKLKATYADNPNIDLLNIAIDDKEGEKPLYKYNFSNSRWASGLASFDKERLINNFDTPYIQDNIRKEGLTVDPNNYLTHENVKCLSFNSIITKDYDFIITDVEGFDIHILQSFPLERVKPNNIIFELPNGVDHTLLNFLQKLKGYGYRFIIDSNDCPAFRY